MAQPLIAKNNRRELARFRA